jgi:eukaryotic-like serine/threonine-protein kinase
MNADRSLLLGVIALQNNFVDRHQLVSAFDRWVSDKRKALADVLVETKAITPEEKALIEALVERHIAKNGGDPGASLAALSSAGFVAMDLKPVRDDDLQASLGHLARSPRSMALPAVDPMATMLPSIRQSGSGSSRFRVLRPHARGGLGEVFVASDDELNRTVALKQIRDQHADNPESRARFMVEAEITGALEHPGIVPIYGLGSYADGRPYYAMRFIRGDSLKDALERYHAARKKGGADGGVLTLRGLMGRFIDVCDAIEYAHCRGILHRDLKPGNIMLGRFGETLVVDWGLARTLDMKDSANMESTSTDEGLVQPTTCATTEKTLMGSAVGTPQYMSPEQAAGRLDILGPRSDVYSLGATLFCVLTGEAPVDGESIGEILQKVQRGNIKSLSDLNPALDKNLKAICHKALAVEPAQRYARASELAADIQSWLADEPTIALPDTLWSKVGRWTRRNQGMVNAVAAAAAITIALLSVGIWIVSAAHDRESKAHQQADESFRAARATVDRYFTLVSEDTLLNQPGLQPLRRELLTDARDYYQAFLKEHAEDTNLKTDLAQASQNLGRIQEELGELDQSMTFYDQAAAAQRVVLDSTPSDLKTKEELSDTLTAAGRVQQKLQAFEKSSQFNAEATKLREALVASNSENSEYQRKLANSYMNAGLLSLRQGQLEPAEQSMRRAQTIRAAFQDKPDARWIRRDFAKGYYNLGLLAVQQNEVDAAQKAFEDAALILEPLVEQQPLDLEQKLLLATCLRLIGDSMAGGADPSLSISVYQRALKPMLALANRNPEVVEYQSSLAGLYMNLSNVQKGKATTAAIDSLNSAIQLLEEINKGKATPSQQRDLAVAFRTRAELRDKDSEAAARQDLARSIEILSALVAEHPDRAEFAQELQLSQEMVRESQLN